ncbi:MAG: hypothetical protein JO235_26985 [Chroococcidiopsidaceae cyanobacterium CP_BM_RX_35]|nr:hypothetical protein [Chroococcidiopsidaceae cyanobacterium CP_BM_RX_35]
MPIPNYHITSIESFEAATKEPRQIAGLYFYHLLDCLVDLSYTVSADFYNRPQLYRHLGDRRIPLALARLNAKYGTDVDFLSVAQRRAIYLPIFGDWDTSKLNGGDSFPQLRDDLIRAAKAFAERAVDTGVEMLREGVRTAHRPFKDYLVELHGDSVRFSKETSLGELTEKNSYPILRDQGVAVVFGISKQRATEYPYATDPTEDLLVEQISKQLSSTNGAQQYITRERISNLQRAALRGAEAIATAIDFEEADPEQITADLDLLITKCYTWGTALESLSMPMLASKQGIQPTAAAAATSTMAPTGYR